MHVPLEMIGENFIKAFGDWDRARGVESLEISLHLLGQTALTSNLGYGL